MIAKLGNELPIVPANVIMKQKAEKDQKEKQLVKFLTDLYYPYLEAAAKKYLK